MCIRRSTASEATEADGPFDPGRDATSLPLIRRALERGVPLLAICRGIQELNVALGGTLASEIQDRPGMWDHRKPDVQELDIAYGIRQKVIVKEGSCLASVLGTGEVQVNSLHRQAICEAAPRLAVEAVAEDGTIEAVSVIDAKAFAVGVQWHPEYWVGQDRPVLDPVRGLRRRRSRLCGLEGEGLTGSEEPVRRSCA